MRIDGYAFIVDPEAPTKEYDTLTCAHCQFIMHIEKRADAENLGGFCRMCMRHICARCVDAGVCEPFERKLDEYERSMQFHTAVRTVLR